jgi:hypothetical protein
MEGCGAGAATAAAMSASVPIIALWVLIALALFARRRSYVMTSTSLLFITAALAAWFLLSYLRLG